MICRWDSSEERSELSSESSGVARLGIGAVVEGTGSVMMRRILFWLSSSDEVLSRESARKGIRLLKWSALMLRTPAWRRVRGAAFIAAVFVVGSLVFVAVVVRMVTVVSRGVGSELGIEGLKFNGQREGRRRMKVRR